MASRDAALACHRSCAVGGSARPQVGPRRYPLSSLVSKAAARRSALLEGRARQMRSALTPSEALLWRALRGKQLGVVFRRQVVVGGFIADFAAPAARLIVEVDGGVHAERRGGDARRDEKLRRLGYRVLRLEAALVLRRLPEAVALVRAAVAAQP